MRILSVLIAKCFIRIIAVIDSCHTSVVRSKGSLFFLSNWQVSDRDRYLWKNVSKFAWKPFKLPVHLYANNYVSLKPLSIILKTSVFFINCSQKIFQFMEDIPVLSRNYSPKSFELFWHAFRKKKCFSLASVCLCLEKLCLQSWVPPSAYGRGRYWRPRAQFLPIRTFRLVNNIYLCCLN